MIVLIQGIKTTPCLLSVVLNLLSLLPLMPLESTRSAAVVVILSTRKVSN